MLPATMDNESFPHAFFKAIAMPIKTNVVLIKRALYLFYCIPVNYSSLKMKNVGRGIGM